MPSKKDAAPAKAEAKAKAEPKAKAKAQAEASKANAAKPARRKGAAETTAAAKGDPEGASRPKRTPAPPQPPVEKQRVVFPKDVYEARKEEIKAPLKESGLKWQYLGDGKGRYAKEGVNLFAQFLDDGVHYSLWGSDRATIDGLLAAWRAMLGDSIFQQAVSRGTQAAAVEELQKESEAIRFWRLQEPQRRPGEPELFFKKRLAEWEAKRPSG